MKFNNLFSPIKIRDLQLRNRVVYPAMATNLIADGGYVTDKLIDYHVARVKGGNGLNITEAASVHTPSAPRNFLSVSDDKFLDGLKKLNDAIHNAGGKSCVQLWQGGFVVASDPAAQIIVPSDLDLGGFTVKGCTTETIQEVVKAYGQAAARCVKAGFDCLEFHAAHGYSPHMFLSGAFNKRTDQYGGSLQNRARYLIECIREIRKNIPDSMPLLMRIVAHDDYVENGLSIEDIIKFCLMAKAEGVDVLDVSRGNASSAAVKYEVPPIDIPRSFNVDNAARIKKETGMTVIAVGRINDPKQADYIISSGKADMVVMGRAQIADAEFCIKARQGREDDIVRCIACNQGCVDRYMQSNEFPHISCLRNPTVGREAEMRLVRTNTLKKVIIAGGGVGGMEAAITLKQRGHNAILCEKSDKLGGQFLLAGLAPRKQEMSDSAISRAQQTLRAGVDIRLNTTVDQNLLEKEKPNAVIIAVGSSPHLLDIKGADKDNVYNSYDVFADRTPPQISNVIVVGGGLIGLEVAEYLAQKNNAVIVIEALDEVGVELGAFRKINVMESLASYKIATVSKTKCVEIIDSGLIVEKEGKQQELKCDYVVIATGSKSNDYSDIKEYCAKNNIHYYVIGDAKKPRKAIDAIHEGAEVARQI
ncbi:MAG: FAD-dependent oxidoreductase [Clostridiales bacterium]|nr:FAD-dependent oxidoreductase [Clostridiales bacterium]